MDVLAYRSKDLPLYVSCSLISTVGRLLPSRVDLSIPVIQSGPRLADATDISTLRLRKGYRCSATAFGSGSVILSLRGELFGKLFGSVDPPP